MPNKLENPVDWWPWCDEVFAKAKKENKAIFISIGYSSCHWCHVMQETVFENKECADILNENYVCIKVDREERPDIDKHYQEVHQLLNKRAGGWPTSVFCTPENKPIFAGAYIPPESSTSSIEGMGFKELSELIASKVADGDEELFKNANEAQDFLAKVEHPKEATVLKEDFTKNFMLQVKNNFDTKNGGFSPAPKFPQASTLNTLMAVDKLYDDKAAKAMLIQTLDAMKKGGIYDLADGGFYRYASDDNWQVPHLEKMLYDNALLCETYTNAYLTYKEESYLAIAKGCADFCYKFMSEDDLFYSSLDAGTNYDKKIQTSWSAMMIKALFTLGQVDDQYTKRAIASLDALMKTLYKEGKLYHTMLIDKEPKVEGFLEDYAYLSLAFISAYKHTQDEMHLINAQRLINKSLEKFYRNGLWNFNEGEFLTKAEVHDNTYISPVSIMIDAMLSLASLLEDKKYTHFAYKTLEYNSYELGRKPVLYPHMLTQTLRYLKVHRD
ncbi:MAG: DUF255 domain-containing protein [Sulfurimonas sp.]|nr:DUF255 domain-containing protein [Sulfurimonas sp.]MDQ7062175.1 DUF255 domain-containing protein [Sulfurimonas sp.]